MTSLSIAEAAERTGLTAHTLRYYERIGLVRVDREHQGDLVRSPGVEPMVMGGRASKGWVTVAADLLTDDASLREWLDRGVAAARASLSPGP